MQNSKLLSLFRQLSAAELRDLRKFVRSPYFNHREDAIQLFDHLREVVPKGDKYLNREIAFKLLYPKKAYDGSEMKLIMHYVFKLFKRFLALQEVEQKENEWQLYLCSSLRKHHLDKIFEQELKKLEKQQQNQPYRNVDYHYLNYQLQQEHYLYERKQKRREHLSLQNLAQELTTFYLADILRHSCTMLTAQRMSKGDYSMEMLEGVLDYLENSPVRKNIAVNIYHKAYLLLSAKEEAPEDAFTNLEHLINDNWQKFTKLEARDIYLLIINYCIRQLNQGKRDYIPRALSLYRKSLEQNLLLENNVLSKYTYNNVLMLAIACQEWDWSVHFLEEYKVYLSDNERENIYSYNLAIFYFRKPDYDQAMKLLQQVSFEDVLYNLNARSMLLRIYFERDEFDALESLLNSFRIYISRQKNLGYHKDNYSNLVSFVRKLLRIPPSDKKTIQDLRQEIVDTPALAEKAWLLSQMDEKI